MADRAFSFYQSVALKDATDSFDRMQRDRGAPLLPPAAIGRSVR
jgi:hypothetical protein